MSDVITGDMLADRAAELILQGKKVAPDGLRLLAKHYEALRAQLSEASASEKHNRTVIEQLEDYAGRLESQLSEAQARLAEIEAQKPVAVFKGAHDGRFVIDFLHGYIPPVSLALYAAPVPQAAQVPNSAVLCKGDYALGTACWKCARCLAAQAAQAAEDGIGDYVIPWHCLNTMQRESIDKMLSIAPQMHRADIVMRVGDERRTFQCDWIKSMAKRKPLADDVVRHIAALAHAGRLRAVGTFDAFNMIRWLTLGAFDKSGTIDDLRNRVDAALLAAQQQKAGGAE